MTCVKYFSKGVKRAGEGSIKWNEYVLDGVWSSDLYSTSHSHGASVTPSPSGYNKVSQWCSEPRRLSHLRHLSVWARTPTLKLFTSLCLSYPPSSQLLLLCLTFKLSHILPSLYALYRFNWKLIKSPLSPLSPNIPSSYIFLPFLSFSISCSVCGHKRTTSASLTPQYIYPEGHARHSPECCCVGVHLCVHVKLHRPSIG